MEGIREAPDRRNTMAHILIVEDEDQFWSAFDAMGRRAVVVTK